MAQQRDWREELTLVIDMMRDLSRLDDPQEAAIMYANWLRKSQLLPTDERLSVSRRNLTVPYYRITRNTRATEQIDPWSQPEKLPMYSSGLLGTLVYAGEPAIINNLPDR